MKTKYIIIIVVVVIIVLLTGILYYTSNSNGGGNLQEDNVGKTEEEKEFSLADFYLYHAGENGEQTFRNAAVEKTEFKRGDFFGVTGSYTADKEAEIQVSILDESKETIEEKVLELGVQRGEDRGFDSCCKEVPAEEGSYYASIKVDGEVRETISFTVSQGNENLE